MQKPLYSMRSPRGEVVIPKKRSHYRFTWDKLTKRNTIRGMTRRPDKQQTCWQKRMWSFNPLIFPRLSFFQLFRSLCLMMLREMMTVIPGFIIKTQNCRVWICRFAMGEKSIEMCRRIDDFLFFSLLSRKLSIIRWNIYAFRGFINNTFAIQFEKCGFSYCSPARKSVKQWISAVNKSVSLIVCV